MAEIKIQRKRRTAWWPVLLVLLIPLAWYFFRVRRPAGPASETRGAPVRASAIAPAGPAAFHSTRPGAWRIDV